MNPIKKISKGYLNFFLKSFTTIIIPISLFLIVVFGLSFLIVLPLWSLATADKELYSKVVIISSGSLISIFLLYKTIKYIIKNGFKKFFLTLLLPLIKKVLKIVVTLLLILVTINMFTYSALFGVIALIFTLFIFGLFKFAFKK